MDFVNSERVARIRALAQAADAQPEEHRREFLLAQCGTDVALFSEVAAFLEAASTAGLSFPGADLTEAEIDGGRLGEFILLRLIGSGATGKVYAAYQPSMNRRVALKILADTLYNTVDRSRFEHEAWIAGRLSHPSIVKVFGQGRDQHLHYLVMECLGGDTLQTAIQQWKQVDWKPRFAREQIEHILGLFIEVVDALDYVHAQGVVHRDIKPSNLLFSADKKRLLLSDFGLALDPDSTRLTKRGDFLGTVRYMSPEQLLASRVTINRRSDIWSLGVTLYEALTLALPFRGETEQAYMLAVNVAEPIPARLKNPAVSRDLETILMKCLEKDSDRRYATAGELRDELVRAQNDEPVIARRPTFWHHQWRLLRRQRRLIVASVVASILLIVFWTSILYVLGRRHNDAARYDALTQFARDVSAGVGVRTQQIWVTSSPIFSVRSIQLFQVTAPPTAAAIQFAWVNSPPGQSDHLAGQTYCLAPDRPPQPVLAGIGLLGLMDLDSDPPLATQASLSLVGHSGEILSFPFVFGRGRHSFQLAEANGDGRRAMYFRGIFAKLNPKGTQALEGRTLPHDLPPNAKLAGVISFVPSSQLAAEYSFEKYRKEKLSFRVSVEIITVVGKPFGSMACE